MSETKRRNKSEPQRGEDFQPQSHRQTRVTLTKDVSSKYRKIMPKSGSGQAGGPKWKRSHDDGSVPPKRGRTGEDRPKFGERPPRRTGEDRPKFGERPPHRTGEDRPKFGERPPRRTGDDRPKFGERPARHTGDRPKFGERPPRWTGGDRPNFGGRSAPHRKNEGSGLEMRAIVNRELPEAAGQVKEVQKLILDTANEMLTLTELLGEAHGGLSQVLSQATDEYQLLGDVLKPAWEHLERANSALAKLLEKMSFQDLAGQRLAKVENFCSALTLVLGRGQAGRESREPREKNRWQRREDTTDRGKEGGSRLKGPQAAGEGLEQEDINQILDDL